MQAVDTFLAFIFSQSPIKKKNPKLLNANSRGKIAFCSAGDILTFGAALSFMLKCQLRDGEVLMLSMLLK